MDISTAINGKLSGKIGIRKIAYYDSTGERMCTAVLKVRMTEEEAVDNLGEEFKAVAFSGLNKTGGEITHGFKSISPAFVFDKHIVEILGKKFPVKPEVPKVVSIEGEEAVEIEIIIPLPVTMNTKKFYSEFVLAVGTTQDVEFALEQTEIPGTGAKMEVVKGGTSRPKGSHGPQQKLA